MINCGNDKQIHYYDSFKKDDIMKCIIETNRLILRELSLDDTEKLSLVLSDPTSMKYYPKAFTKEKVEQWINWNINSYLLNGFGLWAVILKESNELIGDCGITMQEVEGKSYPEIGYHIRKDYCGKGYATEAAKACIDFAFVEKNFEKVYSYMKDDNIPSRKVAEKNGMKFLKYFQKSIGCEIINEALYVKEKEI